MRRWDPLNDRQLTVLQQVAAGDDLRESSSPARRSAGALRDRDLVDISKRDGWRVTLTDAGAFYVKHGCHPDHPDAPTVSTAPVSTARPPAARPSRPRANSASQSTTTKRPPPHATARIARVRRAAAEELVAELLITSTIYLKNLTADELTERRRVVDFAKRNSLVPAGKYIEMKKRRNLVQILLLDGQHPNSKQVTNGLPVVPMPTELRSLHPVVAALQNDRGRLAMPCIVRRRSLLFLHGLTSEAIRRGYDVREQPVPERYRYLYWSREHPGEKTYSCRDGELNIVIDGFAYTVTITQESPQADAAGRWERLVVSLSYRSEGRQYNWYDRKRTTIDDRIAVVLHELETRAAEDKQRQIEAERQKAERKIEWQAAMERARKLAVQAYYARHLDNQADAWRRANQLREYCGALERRIDDATDTDQAAEATRWLAWARDYVNATDPLQSSPTMPPLLELQKSDLEPFLDGWSPYGPEERPIGRRR